MPRAKPDTKFELNDKQRRFAREYLVDRNATQAAIRAGYAPKAAGQQGDHLLKNPKIKSLIADGEKDLARRTEITAEKVLMRWWDIATADPNELVRHEIDCCRHCHGIGHKFQWRDQEEYDKAVATAFAAAKEGEPTVMPSKEGGFGFKSRRKPHPDCPKCEGRGYGRVVLSDTRYLTGPAKILYAGVKQTKFGIEVVMLDKHKALENIARHIGMFNDKLKLEGDADNPLTILLKHVQGTALKPVSKPNEEDEE